MEKGREGWREGGIGREGGEGKNSAVAGSETCFWCPICTFFFPHLVPFLFSLLPSLFLSLLPQVYENAAGFLRIRVPHLMGEDGVEEEDAMDLYEEEGSRRRGRKKKGRGEGRGERKVSRGRI
jgi:hypothetical protein